MALRHRLAKLDREADSFYTTVRLPDGSKVQYTGDDALGALHAAIDGEDHWLLPSFRQIDTATGLPGLIRAWAVSWELHMGEGGR